jgi:hypothetical protein
VLALGSADNIAFIWDEGEPIIAPRDDVLAENKLFLATTAGELLCLSDDRCASCSEALETER